jgi:hypothetical protein
MALSWPELDEGKWNLIAESATAGKIDRLKSEYTYWVTSVAENATAPEDSVKLKSPKIFEDSNEETISSPSAIDVYLWIENRNGATDETGIENAIQVTS